MPCRSSPSSAPASSLTILSPTNTLPASGFRRPMMCLSVTLLPVPLRPSRQNAVPAATSSVTSSSTFFPLKALVTPSRRMAGCAPATTPMVSDIGGKEKEDQSHQDDIGEDDQHRRQHDASSGGPADTFGAVTG